MGEYNENNQNNIVMHNFKKSIAGSNNGNTVKPSKLKEAAKLGQNAEHCSNRKLHQNDSINLSAEELFEAPASGYLREHIFKVRRPRFQFARRKSVLVFSIRPRIRLPAHDAEAPALPICTLATLNCLP